LSVITKLQSCACFVDGSSPVSCASFQLSLFVSFEGLIVDGKPMRRPSHVTTEYPFESGQAPLLADEESKEGRCLWLLRCAARDPPHQMQKHDIVKLDDSHSLAMAAVHSEEREPVQIEH
jgi:hypothetical protein